MGTVLGGYDGRRGMVYHLAVARELRRHGIGARLMQELESRLRSLGCLKYYLLMTPDNREAQLFYEVLDWERMDLHVIGEQL